MAGQTIKWEDFAAAYSKQHNVRSVRVLDRQGAGSVVFIRDKQGKPYKAYKTNGNAYMDVWLLPNGKTKGETVSRFDTHQKDYASPVQAEFPTAKKLMRLHINDMIAIGEGEQRRILCVKTLTGQTILAVDHNEAGDLRKRERTKDKALQYKPFSKSAGQVLQVGLRKVHVSRTGRILDGGPFRRKG